MSATFNPFQGDYAVRNAELALAAALHHRDHAEEYGHHHSAAYHARTIAAAQARVDRLAHPQTAQSDRSVSSNLVPGARTRRRSQWPPPVPQIARHAPLSDPATEVAP